MPTADSHCLDDLDGRPLGRQSFDRFMRWDADLSADLVERIWRDPHALLAEGKKLQDKPRCTVVRIDHASGAFVWKHHNWGTLRRTVKRSLTRSVASTSWSDGRFLHAAGISTPRPRAYLERRFGSFRGCSYLLTDYVEGTSLYRLMRFGRPSRELVYHLARQVATIWQQLDDLRVSHNDLKTENLLVDPLGKVWLIDLDRMRRCGSVDRVRRRQIRDASDLLHPRNWRADPAAAELFRREIVQTPAAAQTLASPLGASHPLSRPTAPANRPSQLVTVLIPCRNSAATIAACVESVRDMADEILVADAGSTDETVEVVRNLGGCRIIKPPCADEAAFEAWAAGQARHPWIFRILPDERLNSELGRQVQDTLATEPAQDGFRVGRHVRFHGRRLKYGGFDSDFSIRLYRKDAARYEVRNGQVEAIVPSGKVGRMKARLVYEAGSSVDTSLNALARRATRAAADARRQVRVPSRGAVLWRVPWQFLQSYIVRWGWIDGWAGLHACCLSAIEVYLSEAKLWELHHPLAERPTNALEHSPNLKFIEPDNASDSRPGTGSAASTARDECRTRPAA